ncbi:MAG: hypothetical protein M0Z53_07850 [Thermaerobacter sp.]|nr:hypothetical protein [Thermaerobacter sp.]
MSHRSVSEWQQWLDAGGGGDRELLLTAAGRWPILISAPHNATTWRLGKTQPRERYTGAIALALQERYGCQAMVLLRAPGYDPGFDTGDPYKRRLTDLIRTERIRVVLDLHGMSDRGHDLEIGTCHHSTAPRSLTGVARRSLAPFTVRDNETVTACREGTVTRTASRHGIIGIHLAITHHLRSDAAQHEPVVNAIGRLLRRIQDDWLSR